MVVVVRVHREIERSFEMVFFFWLQCPNGDVCVGMIVFEAERKVFSLEFLPNRSSNRVTGQGRSRQTGRWGRSWSAHARLLLATISLCP